MICKEYGKENDKIIIFLHGGGLAEWNFHKVALLLEDCYHIIIPVLNGHGDSDTPFTTIENNAQNIIDYIDKNFSGKVFAICGLSLGGQILAEILSQRKTICDYAVIESAVVIPMKITKFLTGPAVSISYPLIKKKWFSRLQFKRLKINDEYYENYYAHSCKISKNSMINFLNANASYSLKAHISDTKSKVLILVGEKENRIVKKSAFKLNKAINGSKLMILKGLYHGQLSLNNPYDYVDIFKNFISDK